MRKRLKDFEADYLGLKKLKHQKGRNSTLYTITEEQWETISYNRTNPLDRKFVETQRKLNKNGNLVSSVEKLQSEPIDIPDNFELIRVSTSKTTGQQWLIHTPKKEDSLIKEIDFEKIIKKYAKPIKFKKIPVKKSGFCLDRLVYTDVHIGMTTNENGYSLYGGKWDEIEILSRLKEMTNHVLENQESGDLIIDELGDFLDGYDGETTRKGHKLPQNMDNEKAYDVGLHFKTKLLDSLAPYFDKIICNNICNDNHAGSFGYTVNSAFKTIANIKYDHVTVNNLRKFINHYFYKNRCFILTHGKDSKALKFGFKPVLDAKQVEKIKNYIDEHYLSGKDIKIEFSKGDSHQKIFDETTSDSFDYYNYLAFSPSSEWVQTNFKKGVSGFEFFNYKDNGQKRHNPYLFDWNPNREEITIDLSEVG